MKRRKPTKMTNVVHSGWMTKSPPERRLTSTFKIFRAQWKRRYFVLSKPLGSLPDQYELDYYKDEHCSSKKGSIDLEQCEQIIEALDSESFPNLLAIKTICRNKVRTYYLAADTETEMNSWVQWLCHVCGLRPEDQPTDIPEPKPPSSNSNGGPASPHTPVIKATPVPIATPSTVQHITKQTSSDSSSASYIPLENCTTGQPQVSADRRHSVESVPGFLAPDPPQKQSKAALTGTSAPDDEVFLQDHIPVPEINVSRGSDLYQIPPVRPKGRKRTDDGPDSSYDVPPPHIERSPRSSFDIRRDSGSGDGRSVNSECYDYPPHRLDSTTSSDSEVPPERPPKPSHLQSPYQNLPPAGKSDVDLMNTILAPPKQPAGRMVSGYDIPRSSHRPVRSAQSSLATTVPPRQQRGNANHTYFNTQGARPISAELNRSGEENKPPVVPHPRSTDLGDDRSSSPSLYQYPPSSSTAPTPPSRPINRGMAPTTVPRNTEGSGAAASGQEENAGIFSTQRTRSFKRNNMVNHGSPNLNQRTHAMPMTALVPAPRPVPQKSKEIQSHEDQENMLSKFSHLDTEEETHHPISLMHSIPPPVPDVESSDRELKYIDLALPDSAQDSARPAYGHSHHTHSHSHGHQERGNIATEYREIDFIKTQALSDAKKVKEKERKIDDHN